MKKIFNTVACLSAALLAFSCVMDQIDTQITDEEAIAQIRLECDALESYTIQSQNPQAVSFRVSSTTPWTITGFENSGWLTVEPASSAVSSLSEDVTVKAIANTELSERSVTLKVTGKNTDLSYSIRVTQMRLGKVTVEPITDEFEMAGGVQSFTVQHNVAWEATVADDWLTLNPASGTSDGEMKTTTVKATAAAHTGLTRTTTVTVVSGEDKTQFLVKQKGHTLEFVPLESYAIDKKGGDLVIGVNSTMDWKVESDNDTFTVTKVGTDQVKVSVPFNNKFAARTANITLKPTDSSQGSFGDSIEATQETNFSLSGHCEVLDDGSVKLYGDDKSRITTVDAYRYISLNAVIGDKNITDKTQMYLCTHDAGDNTEYQCQINLAESKSRLRANGGGTEYLTSNDDATTKFTISKEQLAAITAYRVDFAPNDGKIKLEFFYNGSSVSSINAVSVYQSNPEAVGHYFFGYETAAGDEGWYVVKSLDLTVYSE